MKKKILISSLLIFMLVMSSFVCAEETGTTGQTASGKDITGIVGNPVPGLPGDGAAKVNAILGTLQFIGYAIAIGMLIYVGIRYTFSAVDAKADMKSSMIKYVIGAIVIAGADAIFSWIIAIKM